MRFKSILLAGTMLVLPTAASATDVNPADSPGHTWTGFYLGAHAGHGWNTWGQSLNDGFNSTVIMPSTKDVDGDGWFGGIGGGYDHQFSNGLVLGGEADVSWSDISETSVFGTAKWNATAGADGTSWTKTMELERFGTVRARLGYAVTNSLMVYGTGGYAWANVSDRHVVSDGMNPPHATSTVDQTHHGWTVGGGAELALAGQWSLRGEYLYLDFGREDYAHNVGNVGGTPDLTSSDLSMHTIRAVLTRRFSF